ncbi:MAG: hypothetical protein ACK526_13230 [Planctomyces sp.]|jgi:hypothetical protein
MVCTHLTELYQLCEKHELRLSSSDLIRLVCRQCEQEETCPSVLMDEYDSRTSAASKSEQQEPKSERKNPA